MRLKNKVIHPFLRKTFPSFYRNSSISGLKALLRHLEGIDLTTDGFFEKPDTHAIPLIQTDCC